MKHVETHMNDYCHDVINFAYMDANTDNINILHVYDPNGIHKVYNLQFKKSLTSSTLSIMTPLGTLSIQRTGSYVTNINTRGFAS